MTRTHLTSMIASALLALSLGCGVAQPGDEPGTADQPEVAQRAAALDDSGGGGPDIDPPPPGAKPDITLSSVTPSLREGAVYPGGRPMYLRVRVTNGGTWTTGRSFTLGLKTLAMTGGLPVTSWVVVSALAEGQSRIVEIPLLDHRVMMGYYDFSVTADSLFQVSESSEGNNMLYLYDVYF